MRNLNKAGDGILRTPAWPRSDDAGNTVCAVCNVHSWFCARYTRDYCTHYHTHGVYSSSSHIMCILLFPPETWAKKGLLYMAKCVILRVVGAVAQTLMAPHFRDKQVDPQRSRDLLEVAQAGICSRVSVMPIVSLPHTRLSPPSKRRHRREGSFSRTTEALGQLHFPLFQPAGA